MGNSDITKQRSMINTLERLRIYNVTILDDQINAKYRVKCNSIFDTIIHKDSYTGHSPP
jgi:hypothetical protein